MAKPLYEVLGVPEDVNNFDLRQAFKQRAKETHPDAPGGDGKDFHQVATAYRILRDPDLRAFYDATGRTDTGEYEESAGIHLNLLVDTFKKAISELSDELDRADIIKSMREHFKISQVDMRNALADSESRQGQLLRLKRRLTGKSGKKNVFLEAIEAEIRAKEEEITHNSKGLKLLELVLDELSTYRSPIDLFYAAGYGEQPAGMSDAFGELMKYRGQQ
jgi:DnaJ-class molecular chaperone